MKGNPYLRVKIKSLAEESKIIRQEKNKLRNENRRFIQAVETPEIDLKWTTENKQLFHKREMYVNAMHWHRVSDVRSEARSALLAYQYLRGIPYAVCEQNVKRPPNWARVEQLVKKYGEPTIASDFNHKKWVSGLLNKAA